MWGLGVGGLGGGGCGGLFGLGLLGVGGFGLRLTVEGCRLPCACCTALRQFGVGRVVGVGVGVCGLWVEYLVGVAGCGVQ